MLALILALSLQAQNDSLRAALAKCATVHQVSRPAPAAHQSKGTGRSSGRIHSGTVRVGSGRSITTSGAADPFPVSFPEKVAGGQSAGIASALRGGSSAGPHGTPPPSGFLSGEVNQSLRWRAASGEAEPRPGGAVVSGGNQYRPSPGFYRRHPALTTLGAIGLGALIGAAICNTNHEHGARIEWRTREVLTDPPPPVVWPPDDDEHHHKRGGCK